MPRAPGGGTDILARLVQPGLEKKFGVSIIVDNRPDAAAVMGATIVAKAKPDGYTFYARTIPSTRIRRSSIRCPYDTLKDFTAVTMLAQGPVILLVASRRAGEDPAGADRAREEDPAHLSPPAASAPRPIWSA